MKNLLIYTGPAQKFSDEDVILAKIQIDNSLDLGWDKEDLLIVTDFPFAYNGIKSLVVPEGLYYKFDVRANKTKVINYLFNQNIIELQTLYWCHDFDAYENFRLNENELGLDNYDLGLTHYFYKPEWQFGSLFFKSSAQDVFELMNKTIEEKPHSSRNEEKTLTTLIRKNSIDASRYKSLNVTYNIMKLYLQTIYAEAEKPLKVLHFRPSDKKDERIVDTPLNMFMYGKNKLKIPLMSDRLIKIFNHHKIA